MLHRHSATCLRSIALGLACAALGGAPAFAQSTRPQPATERYDDPVGNGIAIGGVVATGALYANCNDLCDAPDSLPTYAMYAGLGAGIGAGTGWLIDKLHKGRRPAAVPVAVVIHADREQRAVRLQWRF